jgi:hypothetical protein
MTTIRISRALAAYVSDGPYGCFAHCPSCCPASVRLEIHLFHHNMSTPGTGWFSRLCEDPDR